MREAGSSRSDDAVAAAAILALAPHLIGGVLVKARAGGVIEAWLGLVRRLRPRGAPWRRMPSQIADGRLLGGLDLAATLAAGRVVAERGLLAETDGGILVVPMAERLASATAAHLAGVLDLGEVVLERDGLARRLPASIGLVAIDESATAEEHVSAALASRLACHLDLDAGFDAEAGDLLTAEAVGAAGRQLDSVTIGDGVIAALAAATVALGVPATAALQATRVARGAAALRGAGQVDEEDAAFAARLVIAPRATQLPAPPDQDEATEADPPPEPDDASEPSRDESTGALEDRVVAAAAAALPAGLLAALEAGARRGKTKSEGRAGAAQKQARRGRPIGSRRGAPSRGARLDVVETLRAAAPWQPLRREARQQSGAASARRIEVRGDDFRVRRLKQRSQTATIFVVDASGSTALHRLGEAKGAVELLLADCYTRRDEVALIAFGGRGAELLLPPTRSLTRARRNLSDLPGGGGTPLASGIEAAAALADTIRRKGQTPAIVVLTDGRANLTREGKPGRAEAESDALAAARRLAAEKIAALLIDTSAQPHPQAARVAEAMGATYVPLPHADARSVSQAVRAELGGGRP